MKKHLLKQIWSGLVILFCSTILCSCSSYKHTAVSSVDFYDNKEIKENISSYNLYVHQENRLWKLRDPLMEQDFVLKGVLEPTTDSLKKAKQEIAKTNLEEEERGDIHILLKDEIKLKEDSTINLEPDDIRVIKMAAKEDKGFFGTALGIVLAIIGGLILLFLVLIGLLIVGLANSEPTSS